VHVHIFFSVLSSFGFLAGITRYASDNLSVACKYNPNSIPALKYSIYCSTVACGSIRFLCSTPLHTLILLPLSLFKYLSLLFFLSH
jgi:hypothetical protein